MELRQLEHFLAVAEEGSVTGAARRLNLVQSGLSMSIRALEDELGTELFARGARGVTLTQAGAAMLPEARRAVAAVEAARAAVGATQGLLRGTLSIGIAQALNDGRIARILGEFHAEHPGVSVHAFQGSGSTLFTGVQTGRLDVAIAGRPWSLPESITTIQLARAPYALVCSTTHRLASLPSVGLDDLADESFVDLEASWVSRQSTDRAFAGAGIARRIVCELDDVTLLQQMVEHGLGVAIVPHIPDRGASGLTFVPITPPLPEWQLVAGFLGSHPTNVGAQVFLGMLTREWLGP
jgi:DNA-binding transcriptional LysR family regulator